MSTPIEDLERDHRLIKRMLAVLEAATSKLGSDEEVAPEHLERAVEFVRGFADGSHHAKEERCFFPMLAAKGPMLKDGPIRVMLAEHEEGRRFISSLAEGIEAMRAGEPEGRDTARTAIAGYTMLLRDHIAKEEGILFPMAQDLLSANDESQLREEFDRVEEDVDESTGERFEKVVAELEEVFT